MPKALLLGVAAAAFALFNPTSVFAGPIIFVDPVDDGLTVDEEFALNASASGLSPAASYSAKIRLGTTSATLTRGQTKNPLNNPPDDWLSDTDSWAKFPIILADSFGNWSGQIFGRPAENSLPGSNFLTLRLRKVGGTTNYDSSLVSVFVNSLASVTLKPLPLAIDFLPPATITAGETFSVPFTLANASPTAKYFFKGISGYNVVTFNPESESWLAWNASWLDFPSVVTDASGKASTTLLVQLNPAPEFTFYPFLIRLRLDGTNDNLDADPASIFVVPKPASVTAALSFSTVSAQTEATQSSEEPFELEEEPILTTFSSQASILGTKSQPASPVANGNVLVAVGVALFGAALSSGIILAHGK